MRLWEGVGSSHPLGAFLLSLFGLFRFSGLQATYLAVSLLLATTSAAAQWSVAVAGHQGSGFESQQPLFLFLLSFLFLPI